MNLAHFKIIEKENATKKIGFQNLKCFKKFEIRVVDPNTLNLDLDPEFWPNLDLDQGTDPDQGF